MKKIARILSAVLVCCLVLSIAAFAASDAANIVVMVDGKEVEWTDTKPLIDSADRTIAPLRPIANALGLEVKWDDANKTAIFSGTYMNYTRVVYAKIGEKSLRIETYHPNNPDNRVSAALELDTAAAIINERTYAPVRCLAEAFGYYVNWNDATRTVNIITNRANAGIPEIGPSYQEQ